MKKNICKGCEHLKEYHRRGQDERKRVIAVCSLMNITLRFGQDGKEFVVPTVLDAEEMEIKTPFDCPKLQILRMKGESPSVATVDGHKS